ncbi:C40 family peptidase [Alicyclobacillus fastidiosus]|uniref:C40 family peptidase n=1 Tax=Alicyclobacillus fastidiosus TaxID=392011 RepID=A0ABY6ZGY3_9BACL|nr:C40 family peptidase [Alicyclobacillus fastidiosus]WAH41390.1 C40 family peptidase [Alicyclobacillus fastidiosus]GMA63005.1 hypothetical protein GCM10025859_34450 [Alicyclobacillus fastidiosus]
MLFAKLKKTVYWGLSAAMLWTLSGCQIPTGQSQNKISAQVPIAQNVQSHDLVKVVRSEYQKNQQQVVVSVSPVKGSEHGEDIIDLSSLESVVNFATTLYPKATIKHVQVVNANTHQSNTFNVPTELTTPEIDHQTALSQTGDDAVAAMASIHLPPRGVTIDSSIRPVAGLTASHQAKVNAVLSVARSKLGTPYIWGHNEDRGQYGFDCSNFTEYVYHHALGYHFTTASRGQYSSVGDPVPVSQISPGDLIIFEQGAHVGIYVGNNQFINCGGGLGKVGYLSLSPGSYWGNHISAVRRMF